MMNAIESSSITLKPVTGADQRHTSALRDLVPMIWPHHARTMLPWQAVEEFLSANESGAIYSILDGRGAVVGMTGWYWRAANPTNAGLRWTGIAPQFRQNGYFRRALAGVEDRVTSAKPGIRTLSEIIPISRAETLLPIFTRVGFVETPDVMGERSPDIHGTDYLANGIFVTRGIGRNRAT